MKISINWAFDHIQGNIKDVDIEALIKRFNKTTAEIESYTHITYQTDQWRLMRVARIDANTVNVQNLAFNLVFDMPLRPDVQVGDWVLIKLVDGVSQWLSLSDLASTKDGLVAPIYVPVTNDEKSIYAFVTDGWKEQLEQDCIIEIDNKSVTHRPDLWGHRGFAREFAAILGLKLKPFDTMLMPLVVNQYAWTGRTQDYTITIEDKNLCKRFAALTLNISENRPSFLPIVQRLARIDGRAINALVDLTNYVMNDIGQPMHAFDSKRLRGNHIIARAARNKEQLMLLDGTLVSLTAQDIIVADERGPVALAGVMGGRDASLTRTSTDILIESAWFDPVAIRRTSMRYKKRTESSARFEKNLDPYQNIDALRRYVWLLEHYQMPYESSQQIASLGTEPQVLTIEVAHSFIEKRLGVSISEQFVFDTLRALECVVERSVHNQQVVYTVTVPSFRATKDLTIKEDIVEEIGRFFGYDVIPPHLPLLESRPKNIDSIFSVYHIKRYCAYAGRMREVYQYALYDETWLSELQWEPEHAVRIKNPLSEHWQRMVTSLIPHLLKTVYHNILEDEQLRFFEWARIWGHDGDRIKESKSLAGILYSAQSNIDFYESKAFIDQLYSQFGIIIEWQQMTEPVMPWYARYQSAILMHNHVSIGHVGIMSADFVHKVVPGNAFIFELDGDFLQSYKRPEITVVPISKFPEVRRDISMLVPLSVTVAHVVDLIKRMDPRIVAVKLIDRFEKKEWHNAQSLTFRFVIRDMHKTMTTQEVDAIWDAAALALKEQGATIR